MNFAKKKLKLYTNPSGIDSLHQCPSPLSGLHRDLQYAVHVDVIGFELMRVVGCSPSDQNALIELPFEREVLRRRN